MNPAHVPAIREKGRPGSRGKEDPFADLGIALEKFVLSKEKRG
jgi:hypothetical protein